MPPIRIRLRGTDQYLTGTSTMAVPEGWDVVDSVAPSPLNQRPIPQAEPAFNPHKGNPFVGRVEGGRLSFGPDVLIENLLSKLTGVPSKDIRGITTPVVNTATPAIASALLGGAPTALGRVATQAGIGGAFGALRGMKGGTSEALSEGTKGAAVGAAGASIGELLAGLGHMASHTPAYNAVRDALQKNLERTLSFANPAWKGMTLHEMTFGPKAQIAIDLAFKAAKAQIPADATATLSPELATALGTPTMPTQQLVEKLSTLKDTTLKHAAWDAIDASLGPLQAQGPILAARQAYKIGKGWYELATRGKFFDQESFLPEKFREAVTGPLMTETLAPRGMGALGSLATRAMPQPINSYQLSPWTRMSLGSGMGIAAGSALGLPGAAGGGAAGGALGLKFLPHTIYTGVPQLPATQMIPGVVSAGTQALLGAQSTAND